MEKAWSVFSTFLPESITGNISKSDILERSVFQLLFPSPKLAKSRSPIFDLKVVEVVGRRRGWVREKVSFFQLLFLNQKLAISESPILRRGFF